ncbi:unnamed protein product [Schistosoma turkestanicum]|nr:unnamed protein product [Schistosoma turkestanicum]
MFSKTATFWRHEYRIHGRCALEDPLIVGVLGYFNAALALYKRIDLLNKLQMYNITPSNITLYNRTHFEDILIKLYGWPGRLRCRWSGDRDNLRYDLKEVGFCFNSSFAFRNCSYRGNCPSLFYFPPYLNETKRNTEGERRRRKPIPNLHY